MYSNPSSFFARLFLSAYNQRGTAAVGAISTVWFLFIFAGWFLWLLYRYYVTMKWTAEDAAAQFEPPPVRKLDLESQDGDWTDARG